MRRILLAALAVAGAVASATWWLTHDRFDMRETLAQIAADEGLWDNQYDRNLEKANDLLAAANGEIDRFRRLDLEREAARQFLLGGQPEAGVGGLRKILDEVSGRVPGAVREALTADLAIAYLRLGEAQNCIWNHNVESCLIPITGKGVHTHRVGSREAARLYSELLADPDTDPANLPMYRWLLNIAHMTLGEYPDGIAPPLRIPPEAFESDHDIGRFTDVALSRGLNIVANSGGAILEDFDNDGDLDLFVTSWGIRDPAKFFLNRGDGSFVEHTEAAGLDGITGGLNANQADYDNDGDADIMIYRGAWLHANGKHPNSLLRNDGNGTFTDVTARAGVLSFHPTHSGAWCDFNNDGALDLLVGNELHPGVRWPADAKNVELFLNNGDGTFTESAKDFGRPGMIKGVVCGDYDNDGWPDAYLSTFGSNRLFRNLGPQADGAARFEDVTDRAGVAEPGMAFTSWFFDYDNDGWEDLFVSGYSASLSDIALEYLGEKARAAGHRPRLYRNNHDGTFTDVSRELGVDELLLTMGANFGDLDNDGFLDFYLGTGAPPLHILVPNRMFRNDGGRRFQDVTTSGGFGHLQKAHGVTFGDVDGDGDQDVFEQMGGAYSGDRFWSVLYDNPGHGNNWVKLRLVGATANRSGAGARIRITAGDAAGSPRHVFRTVSSGGSFGSSSLRIEVGLGSAREISAIEVRWPGPGTTQVFEGPFSVNRTYELRQESGFRPQ